MIQSKEVLCVSFDLLFLIPGFQVRSEPLKVVGVDQIDPCSNEFVPHNRLVGCCPKTYQATFCMCLANIIVECVPFLRRKTPYAAPAEV